MSWASRRVAQVVGAELRRLREREGLTLRELADALTLPRPVVGRRELGKHLPCLASLDAQARAAGGSLGHLLLQLDLANGVLPRGAGR